MDESSKALYDTILNSRLNPRQRGGNLEEQKEVGEMPFWFTDNGLCEDALDMIASEDARQIETRGYQKHHIHKWMIILSEEFGELNKAVLGCQLKDIIKEATRVATIALKIAWMARRKFED